MTSSPPIALSLLAPGFALAGLLLAGIPILIHLLNRRRYHRVRWAAMDLLLKAIHQNRRRARFENWLLLAARCLLLAMMGLALARPMGCDSRSAASLSGRSGLVVLVIDNSYTLSYLAQRPGGKTNLDEAKSIAGGIIDQLNSGGQSVAILSAAKPAESLSPPTYDLQQAKAILTRIPQTFGPSDLPAALQKAVELGRAHTSDPDKSLYLLTDTAASAWQTPGSESLKTLGPELAKLFHVSLVNVSSGEQSNQAVLSVHPSSSLITTKSQFGADFIADLKGFGAPADAELQWKIDGKLLPGDTRVHLDLGTRPQIQPQSNLQAAITFGGPHAVTATLLNQDALQADNSRTRVINILSQLKTLIVEGQHGSGKNLRAALAGLTRSGHSDGFADPDLINSLDLQNRVLTDYQAVILCGINQFTPDEADQLQTFATRGGALLIFAAPDIVADNYNTLLLPRHLMPGPIVKRVITDAAKGFYFDFNPNAALHPLLKAFAHQAETGLDTAQAFGYWQTDAPNDPQLRVLNWKSTGTSANATADPAITQQTLGQGKVIFISTSADEQWITFTRKPIYTELVNELLSGSINVGDDWMNLSVGDRLVLPPGSPLTPLPALTDPQSLAIPLQPVARTDGSSTYQSPPLNEPGIYTLQTPRGSTPIAVNIPAAAMDPNPIGNTAAKAELGGIDLSTTGDQPITLSTQSPTKADWSWALLLLVLALLGVETGSARYLAPRQKGAFA